MKFDQDEPRLDDVSSMSKLRSKVREDNSISVVIDNIARCMIASLFYFELNSKSEIVDDKFVEIGAIQCEIRRHNSAFSLLLLQLVKASTTFYLNDSSIPGMIGDVSFLDVDGNFRKPVELNVDERFIISIKQARSAPCNISGSPYSVRKLILAQRLDAHFGTADHRKRKRSGDDGFPASKKRRI